MAIIIDKEFKDLIPPLTEQEYAELESDIITRGCRTPLDVWNGILIDGHNRYEICKKHKIEFQTKPIKFADKEEAKIWIITNQLSRRNLPLIIKGQLLNQRQEIIQARQKAKENKVIAGKLTGRGKVLSTNDKTFSPINVQKARAEELGVSTGTVAKMDVVLKKADKDTIKKIEKNELTINQVYGDLTREEKIAKARAEVKEMKLPEGTFDVILADPPWQYEYPNSDSRKIENQYETQSLEQIKQFKFNSADNSILFLWVTAPKLEEGLEVLNAWGFKYRTGAIWDKMVIGMGYYFRIQHEHLLVGIKGNFSPPLETKYSSVIQSKRGKHSEKPELIYEMIEKMYPDRKYLELYARTKRKNWESWGNQVN